MPGAGLRRLHQEGFDQLLHRLKHQLCIDRALSECYGYKNGKFVGHSTMRSKPLRKFMQKNPRIGKRIRTLAYRNRIPIFAAVGKACRIRHGTLIAAPALLKIDGVNAYEAIMRATSHLWEGERSDIISLMFVAIGEGRLLPRDAEERLAEFVLEHRRQFSKFGPDSLDRPLYDDSLYDIGRHRDDWALAELKTTSARGAPHHAPSLRKGAPESRAEEWLFLA